MWIHAQIRLNLLIRQNIRATNIKIVIEDKEVFLFGEANHTEIQYIEKLANTTYGVKNIFINFTHI